MVYVLLSLCRSKIGYFPDEILKYRSLWHSNATMYQLKIWERSPWVIKIGIEPFSPFYRISCEVCLSLWVFDRDSLSHKKKELLPPVLWPVFGSPEKGWNHAINTLLVWNGKLNPAVHVLQETIWIIYRLPKFKVFTNSRKWTKFETIRKLYTYYITHIERMSYVELLK